MKFSVRACSCVPTFHSHSIFLPSNVEHLACLVWTALAQIDSNNMRRFHQHSHCDWLELEVNIVTQPVMAQVSVPLLRGEQSLLPDRRPRHFHQFLNPRATDIVAFPFLSSMKNAASHLAAAVAAAVEDDVQSTIDANSSSRSTPIPCGSIFLCPAQMYANLGPPVERRTLPLLPFGKMDAYLLSALSHSMLHIFSYRHDTAEEMNRMVVLEKKVARAVKSWIST